MRNIAACARPTAWCCRPDTTAAEGASCFVNPLTALGMVETMRREGHTALVHTAAASNLGQMLNKICLADGIGLVNIVRSPAQADILRAIGAKHVCDSYRSPLSWKI
jgi:NADPH2:quinone reductase